MAIFSIIFPWASKRQTWDLWSDPVALSGGPDWKAPVYLTVAGCWWTVGGPGVHWEIWICAGLNGEQMMDIIYIYIFV